MLVEAQTDESCRVISLFLQEQLLFSHRIITCLLPVCLSIFSRLKLLKSRFWGIIWVK